MKKMKVDLNNLNMGQMVHMIPGSLIYKGKRKKEIIIERHVYGNGENKYSKDEYIGLKKDFIDNVKKTKADEVSWINVIGFSDIDAIIKIGELFNIDSLILEQVVNLSSNSISSITEDYVYLDALMLFEKNNKIEREKVSLFYSKNTVITFQEKEGDVFDEIRRRLKENDGYIRKKQSSYTFFCLLDALVDHYLYILDNSKNMLEKLELDVLDEKKISSDFLHELRKKILLSRFSVLPLESFIKESITKKLYFVIEEKKFYDSLYRNISHAVSETNIQKEMLDSMYEYTMMINSNKMNQIMTTLTIFSAIFIPLSFLTGVFGMNFVFLPWLDNENAFIYFVIGCVITSAFMISLFKIKKWF